MHGILDDLLVGVVLLASVIYAAFSLGPRTLRRRLLVSAAALLRSLPRFSGLHEVALRLETAASTKAKGSCGGCDNCGSDQPPTAQNSPSEVKILPSKIGKRR
jgi:hypothetical protein